MSSSIWRLARDGGISFKSDGKILLFEQHQQCSTDIEELC